MYVCFNFYLLLDNIHQPRNVIVVCLTESKFHTKSFVPLELFVRNKMMNAFIFSNSNFRSSKVMFLQTHDCARAFACARSLARAEGAYA